MGEAELRARLESAAENLLDQAKWHHPNRRHAVDAVVAYVLAHRAEAAKEATKEERAHVVMWLSATYGLSVVYAVNGIQAGEHRKGDSDDA